MLAAPSGALLTRTAGIAAVGVLAVCIAIGTTIPETLFAFTGAACRADVRWKVTEDQLAVEMQELGGPIVESPEQTGFGFVLMKGQVQQQLEGTLDTLYGQDGLIVKMGVPL